MWAVTFTVLTIILQLFLPLDDDVRTIRIMWSIGWVGLISGGMHKFASIGRIFFAIALIGLGIEHFVFEEFITGRAPKWPEGLLPGRVIWAYVSGGAVIVMGIAILTGKNARLAGILAGTLIFIWAFLRHIPVVAGDSFLAPTWTVAGKALAMFGGAFAIAGTLPKEEHSGNTLLRKFMSLTREFIVLGQVCLGTSWSSPESNISCTPDLWRP